ncbi:MAG: zinc metalloprotease HtpX [Candidatus Marsarchaeota archaeon]|nr:zinc metalloprotease HtpX [Candidatus Marsarchaeota archaeon]
MITAGDLRFRMYITLILSFAIGFGIIYALLLYAGAGIYPIVAIAALFFLFQWYISPHIMAMFSRIRYIKDDEYPQLHKLVEELSQQADVPVPRIAIAPAKEPNAFVFGRTKKSATLVVHEGLLPLLDANELRAVLAHEIGHLKHNDIVVITMVSFIPLLAYIVAQSLLFSSIFGGSRNNDSYLVLFGLIAFVVYFISELLMLSLSRVRESFADEYSANSTQQPGYLASALLKITASNSANQKPGQDSTIARSLYIMDFFSADKDIAEIREHMPELKRLLPGVNVETLLAGSKPKHSLFGGLNSLFATHPPTYRRLIDLAEINDRLR